MRMSPLPGRFKLWVVIYCHVSYTTLLYYLYLYTIVVFSNNEWSRKYTFAEGKFEHIQSMRIYPFLLEEYNISNIFRLIQIYTLSWYQFMRYNTSNATYLLDFENSQKKLNLILKANRRIQCGWSSSTFFFDCQFFIWVNDVTGTGL